MPCKSPYGKSRSYNRELDGETVRVNLINGDE
jgi:hypothetical protein